LQSILIWLIVHSSRQRLSVIYYTGPEIKRTCVKIKVTRLHGWIAYLLEVFTLGGYIVIRLDNLASRKKSPNF
jgi:hypothetical protein